MVPGLSRTTCRLVLAVSVLVLTSCGDPERELASFELAILSISEGLNYDYGVVPVGQSVEKTFIVTNVGLRDATDMRSNFHITAFQYFGGRYPGFGGTCTDSLAPDESCTVIVSFAPIFVNNYSIPLQIVYFNGIEEVITSRPVLNGTGIGP